jgi:hypothetical protein
MARIIDDESKDEARDTRHKVKLTERCKPVLLGDTTYFPGDEVELFFRPAQELCEKALAVPVGVVTWFKAKVKKVLAPEPSIERWDEPGNGREFVCKVCEKRAVYQAEALRSYGDGVTLYLSLANARIYHSAGCVTLVNPERLPVRDEPGKAPLTGLSRFGTSALAGAPNLASDNIL